MKLIMYGLIAAVLALSVVVAVQFSSIAQSRAAGAQQVCTRIASLDNTLVGLVRQSEKSLTKFAYYRQHPDELRIVLQQDESTIRALTPPRFCN